MRVMSPFFSNFNFNGGDTVLSFELGCGPTKNHCIDAWSTRGPPPAIGNTYRALILIIARDISRNVINRTAEVELHLCACHGDNPDDESSLHANNYELYDI